MSTYISISEMAKLHGITRQTLIHYDNIDLFKPAKVDTNGYRYYCKHQIPYLREICFLKSLGISLKDIQQHFQDVYKRQNCTCKTVNCVRHGKCCECINHHREKGSLVACMKAVAEAVKK